MNNKKNIYTIIALTVMTLTAVTPVFAAETNQPKNIRGNRGENRGMMRPSIFGTVASITGNIITVNGKQGFGANTTTTTVYNVDATNAKITKSNVAGTISSILVGDIISAQGTISGTNLVATNIRDGVRLNGDKTNNGIRGQNQNLISGNGLPVVAGTVTSINGTNLVITNKSNVSYTVDATNAKIVKGQNIILVSNITVGDVVIVQGTVNGNSVAASSITDQGNSPTTGTNNQPKINNGFFGRIGSFFSHLFGF